MTIASALLLASACGSSQGGDEAVKAVRETLISPGSQLVLAELDCDAESADDGWVVSCEPVEGSQYDTHPEFLVEASTLEVSALNKDAERMVVASQSMGDGAHHECYIEEMLAGTIRLVCKK